MSSGVSTYDVVIIGGGLTGLTMALSLAQKQLSVALIDRNPIEKTIAQASDGRCSAITLGSARFFETLGLWSKIHNDAGPICDIRVTDGHSKSHIHFDHRCVSKDPMGYIIPNHIMLKGLSSCLKQTPNVTFFCTNHYTQTQHNSHVEINFETQQLHSSLLIAADGRRSQLRQHAAIGTLTHSYHQTGIVCSIEHEEPHHRLAHERFLPTGPFAALPLIDPHQSSLVWTEKPELAKHYLAMEEDAFTHHIEQRLNHCLGKVTCITARFSYPLTLALAQRYVDQRMVLIGDAAHGIHPLAGQGFNLGIRDVMELTKILAESYSLGLDLGSNTQLKAYEKLRHFDSLSLAAVTSGLNTLFLHDSFAVKLIRRFGLGLVNQSETAKKSFMKHAMGIA